MIIDICSQMMKIFLYHLCKMPICKAFIITSIETIVHNTAL